MKGNFEPNKKEINEVGRWNSDIVLKLKKKNQFLLFYVQICLFCSMEDEIHILETLNLKSLGLKKPC